MGDVWTDADIQHFSRKYGLHDLGLHYHFPRESFLSTGYAPPGGYVKDFCVLPHQGRWHVFHIDGRPGEVCWITGNEISFGHASTSDFRHWIRHNMPLAVSERPWENKHIYAPFVYSRGDLFYMFYMGVGQEGAFITHAVSTDLETWSREGVQPIRQAEGRDPFLFEHDGCVILVYTKNAVDPTGALRACATSDMREWTPLPDVLQSRHGAPESASVHPYGDGYVLWFNDWGAPRERFRACYTFSDDPLRFDGGELRAFQFECGPDQTPIDEAFRDHHRITDPVPTSIELIACGPDVWLVAYFRMVGDGFRLFFGELDWSTTPATIREVRTDDMLQHVLARVEPIL